MQPRPTTGQIIIYALGQFGWALASFCVANALIYFYAPPEDVGADFPAFIQGGAIFLGLTLIGIIGFGGRILDGLTDPLIATYSDRMQSKMGKRKKLMAISVLPFALFGFLVFYPISDSLMTNSIWLIFVVIAFYVSFTGYLIPYTALIAELGHHQDDRLKISMFISIAFALAMICGAQIYGIQESLEQSYTCAEAFQAPVLAVSMIGLVMMLVPIIFLDENKYAQQNSESPSLSKAFSRIKGHRNFKYFVISDLLYWLALTFIQLGMVYYVTLLFGMEKSAATSFLELSFVLSFLFYFMIYYLNKKVGKKWMMISGFMIFIIVFGLIFFMPLLGIPLASMFYLFVVLTAYALAVFGVLPNVIIADIVNEEEKRTGQSLSAVFYGARNFMMKIGISLANLLFPSLLLFGKSLENSTGVKYSVLVAMVFSFLGLFIFLRYREKELDLT